MQAQKTIIEKLNLDKYSNRLILNMPQDLKDFQELKHDTSVLKDKYDLIILFIFSMEDFDKNISTINEKIEKNGYLYVAYPKKNNPTYKEYIERDSLYESLQLDEEKYLPNSILKFSRMVSLNDTFTVVGMKAVPPKKKATTAKKSQCVDDYIVHIDDIRSFLKNNEEVLAKYDALTYGYQKDWARYVYSAKREETQEKRLLEMVTILGEGYKSMDLYRREKK
ncbi:hypothetical protein FIU87_01265 [Bacillus sp. THAF10]|uniref:YdeI/OmpD-associated family protein n=1 Tax=Bacillus sp. THAF10 TaxID=2587848 RepID=UPI0012697957|nr:YdeI/OmpD-associated family protein [Bacillus sp. THAF10]QFT87281.1 hypothetical protein FIU87_01265 [Bacillus sp. THAF10]